MNDDTDIMWCRVKLIHWLPDSDVIVLTDKFHLVSNFTVYETSSQLSIRSLIPKHFCHIMSSCIKAHAKQWNSPSTRLISRDFSVLFRLPELSFSQTENSLSTKACEAVALPTDQQPKLRAGCLYAFSQLLSQNSRGLSSIIRLVWISAKCISWLSPLLWLTWMHVLASCQCL